LSPQEYYTPSPRGFEAKIAERIAHWDRLRSERG
jgi:putative ATPase